MLLIILAAIAVIFWSGIRNYRRRIQQEHSQPSAQVLPAPDAAAPASDSADSPYSSPLTNKQAPDFTLEDTTGKRVSLSSYKGKGVLVNFWATWCAPCKIEIPWFIDFQKQYAGQGLQILGVSDDDLDKDDKKKLAQEKSDISKFAAKMQINYPVLFDGNSIAKPYGDVDSLPTSFYIDRSGKVVTVITGLAGKDEIEANIKKALGQGGK